VLAAATAEVDALGHAPSAADLPRLPLAMRIFKETLRLYPPVYLFSRQLLDPTSTLNGVAITRPTLVFAAPYALHRRPELYPDPERFDPDHFLPEREKARPRLAWIPFGAGPRVCIGSQFALLEGQIVLATLLYHARFEPLSVVTPDPSVTFRPGGTMPMRVRVRRGQG
ncbi:MAG: cytochrome P450, partial [Proteobacteria bacterium]